jgi:hypothetical protein
MVETVAHWLLPNDLNADDCNETKKRINKVLMR